MDTRVETARIELEEAGRTSWWASLLSTLLSQNGNAQLRFVARRDGTRILTSSSFASPRTFGPVGPREAWAPGMTQSLEELCGALERDGWVRTGTGAEPWAYVYERVEPVGAG